MLKQFWKKISNLFSNVKNEKRIYKANLIIFILCLIWVLAIIIAPLTLPPNTVNFGENGKTYQYDFTNQTENYNLFAKAMYNLGDANCHQKSSRSLFINGNEMPFCSRDFGIFLGLAIGVGITVFRKLDIKVWWIILGLTPIAIDGIGQTILGLWESINPVRIITGTLAGIITGVALGIIVQEILYTKSYSNSLKF